jgi:hypothetical protein
MNQLGFHTHTESMDQASAEPSEKEEIVNSITADKNFENILQREENSLKKYEMYQKVWYENLITSITARNKLN